MGYEVHITRKDDWSGDSGPIISLEDWLGYISGDPEMRADRYAEAETSDGSTIRIDDPGIAVWVEYSGHDVDGNMAWFSHFEDHVSVKNPDEEILSKMYRIAAEIGANVQGDDGEQYGEDGRPCGHNIENTRNVDRTTERWWRFWD